MVSAEGRGERYAIVIGVDNYDPRIGKLDSAVSDALGFASWVTRTDDVPVANLRLLLEPDPGAPAPALPPGVNGFSPVTARKIKETIVELRNALPAGGAERLYFYYAGHGASIPVLHEEPILISPKFVDRFFDDHELLSFKDLFNWLGALTFKEQICLIDACRDFALPEYEPMVLSGVRPRLADRQSCQYVLYSVAPGQKAAESERGGGIWTRALLDALEGRDYRAVTPGDTARSAFEIRLDHLASRIRGEVKGRTGRLDARRIQIPEYDRDRQGDNPLLAVFTEQTVPRAKLRIFVEPPLAHQTCKVSVTLYVPGHGELLEKSSPPPLRVPVGFELFPRSYSIRAEAFSYTVASRGWTVLDEPVVKLTLEQVELAYEEIDEMTGGLNCVREPRIGRYDDDLLGEVTRGIPEEPPRGKPLSYSVPPELPDLGTGTILLHSADAAMRFEVLDDRRRVIHQAVGGFKLSGLQPGIYRLRVSLPGLPPREETVDVRPGAEVRVTPSPPATRLSASLLDMLRRLGIEIQEKDGVVEYVSPSEALGPLAGVRLASLLAFASCAAQQPDTGLLRRLRSFGVQRFDAAPGSAGGVLVLVGSAADRTPAEQARFLAECRLSLRSGDGCIVELKDFKALSGLPAAAQRSVSTPRAGMLAAELLLPGLPRTRYALAVLPERFTTFIAVVEEDGTVEVQQYLLRIPGRSEPLDPASAVRSVRRLGLAQSFYAAGEPDAALDAGGPDLDDLLKGWWIEPLLGCLAGYGLVRLGQTEKFTAEALPHLLRVFPQLPDLHVLAGLCDPNPDLRGKHFEEALQRGLPLFAQGLRALAERFPQRPNPLAEPLASPLPGSPWTAWIARSPW